MHAFSIKLALQESMKIKFVGTRIFLGQLLISTVHMLCRFDIYSPIARSQLTKFQ